MAEDYAELLRSQGLKATEQRIAILEALHELGGTADARELFEKLRDIGKIHKTTIYRNLQKLEETAIVRSFFDGTSAFRYHLACEHGPSVHPHFVCSKCKGLYCLEPADLSSVWNVLSQERGFVAESADVRITGLCGDCREEQESA